MGVIFFFINPLLFVDECALHHPMLLHKKIRGCFRGDKAVSGVFLGVGVFIDFSLNLLVLGSYFRFTSCLASLCDCKSFHTSQ